MEPSGRVVKICSLLCASNIVNVLFSNVSMGSRVERCSGLNGRDVG